LRPRFFLIGAAVLTWLPLTRLRVSTSTEGERTPLPKKADESSGGKEVWRSGCANPAAPEAVERVDAFRRLRAGAPGPSAVRFLLVDMLLLLMPGGWLCEYGGECADDGEAIVRVFCW
jgi:hypothetical protein